MPGPLTGGGTLLLTTDAVGGVWRYSLDLARGLKRHGLRPILAILGPAPGPARRAEAEGLDLAHTGLPLDWTAPDPAALHGAAERLAGLAALTGAASVHLHAPALLGTAAWPVPVVAVTHSCLGTWWAAMRPGTPLPPDFAWRAEATGAGLHAAAAVIAPSRAHADATVACYGPLPISVVHNGLPPAAQTGPAEPSPHPILAAGRLYDEAKDLRAIDAAAAATGLPIAAAGPTTGPNGDSIVLPHLHLLGELDAPAMVRAYAGTRVFVSMSRYEPFGLSVAEAAAAGCHLVLSDIPTFRELWDGAATFATPETLPARLRDALAAPDGAAARARAARYSIDRTVDATLAVHAGITA